MKRNIVVLSGVMLLLILISGQVKSETLKSGRPKSEAPKSEALKSEALKSEALKSEALKSEALKSERPVSGAWKTEVRKTADLKSDLPKENLSESGPKKLDPSKQDRIRFVESGRLKGYKVRGIPGVVFKKTDREELKLNLYLPVKEDGTILKGTPLLIHIGGGCMVIGGPSDGWLWRTWGMVQRGYVVAGISHRNLLKGYPLPAQYEDVRAAVRFLRANASKYGYDPKRFVAMGASSAGVLATVLGISDKHKIFDVGENTDQSGQVQCVINFCSSPDLVTMIQQQKGHLLWCMALMLGAEYPEGKTVKELAKFDYSAQVLRKMDEARKFSVITYVDENYAPTITLHGLEDPAVPPSQACLFQEALHRAGVVSEIHLYPHGKHSPATYGKNEPYKKPIIDFIEKIVGKPVRQNDQSIKQQ